MTERLTEGWNAVNKECAKFLAQAKRHFGPLGFDCVQMLEGEYGLHCLVVMQSPWFRLKLVNSFGGLAVMVGPLSAPVQWRNDIDGREVWFHLSSVVNYLDRTPVDLEATRRQSSGKGPGPMDAMLERFGVAKLRPVTEQLANAFSVGSFERWREEYELYWIDRKKELNRQSAESDKKKMAERTDDKGM